MNGEYLIWSVEHGAWWRPKRTGYTESYDIAGRYSKQEAYNISARANWNSLNEVPVPADFFEYQQQCHEQVKNIEVKSDGK